MDLKYREILKHLQVQCILQFLGHIHALIFLHINITLEVNKG